MPATDAKQTKVWNRWITYLGTANRAHDPFLESLDASEHLQRLKPTVISGFAQALRTGQLQTHGRKSVVAATVQSDIGSLVQTFRDARRKNPTLDSDGKLSTLLSWQYAGFKNFDPPTRRQKAISLRVLKFVRSSAITELDFHTADLAIGAFFFACRSCEYLKVKGKRRTKTLRIQDIEFRKGRVIVPHDSPDLHLADKVTLFFRDQKNRVKGVCRTAWRTSDPDACPVIAYSNIIRRVTAIPGSTKETFIYNYAAANNRSLLHITDTLMILALRAAVSAIGEDELGYKAEDIGTHSIRSGAAMALVLSHHAAWRIMLAGRWQSQAFLVYIREQIPQFSIGVSERMTHNADFYHVPDIDNPDTNSNSSTHANSLDTEIFNGQASSNYGMPQLHSITN
jgi:hypothetical protein